MKQLKVPVASKSFLPRLVPAGFFSYLVGPIHESFDNARIATHRLCLMTGIVSLVVLGGWAAGFDMLARGLPSSGPLPPLAALCFLALALALANNNRDPLSHRSKVLLALAAVPAPLVAVHAAWLPVAEKIGPMASAVLGTAPPYSWSGLCWLSLAMSVVSLLSFRRHTWGGDVLGALIGLLVIIHGVFLFGYIHKAPIFIFRSSPESLPFLGCVNMVMMGFAVLARLGPHHFPLRFLAGSSVRAVILRHFLPVAAAMFLVTDVLNFASAERKDLALFSFLFLLLSLIAVAYLSLRSAQVIGRRIENSLRESEQRYAVLVDSLKDHAVFLLDPEGHILTWNAGAERIHGFKAEAVLGDHVSRFYPPEERDDGKMESAFREATARGFHEEQGWIVRKDGSRFWAETVTTPFLKENKTVLGFSQVMRDITLRKKAQDGLTSSLREKEALLKEIHHRVKNNLQMISSLLRLQSVKIQDPALLAIFLESQNRIRSMAILHECLYQSADLAHMNFADYVEKLSNSLVRTYSAATEKTTVRLDVEKIPLSVDTAIPCGLILTELVSNALKYAYPPGKEGPIFIGFRALAGSQYELTVADQGVGLKLPVNFDSTDSLGLRLVHILTEQLRGQIRVENGSGAKFTVTFKELAAHLK